MDTAYKLCHNTKTVTPWNTCDIQQDFNNEDNTQGKHSAPKSPPITSHQSKLLLKDFFSFAFTKFESQIFTTSRMILQFWHNVTIVLEATYEKSHLAVWIKYHSFYHQQPKSAARCTQIIPFVKMTATNLALCICIHPLSSDG